MSVQASHERENLKMRKFTPSRIPSSSSSLKNIRNFDEILTKEAIESWIDKNPDSYMTSLASSFGVHYTIILKYCKKYGISFDRTKITRESLKHYLLSNPNVSYQDIADHFGVVKSTAKKSVDYHGFGHLKKHQTRWRNSKNISKENLEIWMKDHPHSLTKEAAVNFGVSIGIIIRLLKKYGLRIHKRKGLKKTSDVSDPVR